MRLQLYSFSKSLWSSYNARCTCSIVTLIMLIWTFVKVHMFGCNASITCLHKKDVMSRAVNYRNIITRINMSRILAKLVMGKLKTANETHIGKKAIWILSKLVNIWCKTYKKDNTSKMPRTISSCLYRSYWSILPG